MNDSCMTTTKVYSTIRIPESFIKELVDPLLKANLGFTSNADVIRAGVREIYEKFKDFIKEEAEA